MSVKALVKVSVNVLDNIVDAATTVVKTTKAKPSIFTKSVSDTGIDVLRHAVDDELRVVTEVIERTAKSTPIDNQIIQELGISRLRILENGNLSGGTFATRDPAHLVRLKEAGVKRIVDFRNEAGEAFEKLCKELDIEYLRFPIDNTRVIPGRERMGMAITDDFVKELKKYIEMVNKGQTYQGCHFGIDRTNLGLTLNYLLNPKATKPPILLSWGDYSLGNVVNRTTKSVKKIIKKLTPEQRKMLDLPEDFEKYLMERIFELRNANGVLRINRAF